MPEGPFCQIRAHLFLLAEFQSLTSDILQSFLAFKNLQVLLAYTY